MKKILYILTVIATGLVSSCNPVDDIYDDLKAEEKNPLIQVGDVTFELSDDDYDELEKSTDEILQEMEEKKRLAKEAAEKRKQEEKIKAEKAKEARELAEFNRLKAKFNK